jgi:membrane complex biogenesis BtpA family protein
MDCIESAVRDAIALETGGVDSLIVENFGDAPFRATSVDAHTVASMTRVVQAVRESVSIPIGVNVLRNDAAAALGIALACDAQFIRVNIHTGVMATDQGIVAGRADETMRLRRQLGAEHILVFADVLVKHASPIGQTSLTEAVEDAIQRGLADAVIVSGIATGKPAEPDDVRASRRRVKRPYTSAPASPSRRSRLSSRLPTASSSVPP